MTTRQERAASAAAASRAARLDAFLALMPPAMPPAVEAEWRKLAECLADDPPAWSPAPRFAGLMRAYCAELVRERDYDAHLQSARHELMREKNETGADRLKANPLTSLRAACLKRLRGLEDALELSPKAARKAKGSQFDAA